MLKQYLAAVVAIAISLVGSAWAESPTPPNKIRNVHFIYATEISPANPNAKYLDVWIPLPCDDSHQSVSNLTVTSAIEHEIVDLRHDGNRVVHLSADAPIPNPVKAEVSFDAVRREQSAELTLAARAMDETPNSKFAEWLRPDKLVPTDGRIAQVSAIIPAKDNAPPLEQARAIYEYVTANMRYDKSGTGWGRGDAIYACNVKRGNCTDFHSLLIALDRNRRIPARFIIGFPLPDAKSGEIPGYHCWAEFYSGAVWVPVDASEAWKHPERHDYYFGHLDADRVAFTMGRDLQLSPSQHGDPLNFLIYPYAELDGTPVSKDNIKNKFTYRDIE